MEIIEARELSVKFGAIRALSDVSFKVRKGEILGLLGPNGAGKTTAMRILTTYLVPTSGTAIVAGCDVQKDPIQVRRQVGYLPETVPLYHDMEVREYLHFVGRGRGLGGSKLREQLDYVLQACEIRNVYRRPIQELSKGYKQRVGLAQALIHDPEILILDEPTSGLDPLQILTIRNLIRDLLAKGKTIIFSTHILQEVSAVTERVVIISEGRIVADGTINDLRMRAAQSKRTVAVIEDGNPEVERQLQELQAVVQSENGIVRAVFPGRSGAEVFDVLKSRSWRVREIREETLTLEDVFVQLIRESRK